MLSLLPKEGRLQRADNLLPSKDGTLAARPGAIQLMSGAVSHAAPWGNRVLAERDGRFVLWDGTGEYDIAQAGTVLRAAPFQALTQNAAREDRLYAADGINPLWFIARRAGSYVREFVVNTVTDTNGAPYPIPVPRTIANWRNRLWIAWGSNRAQHCQNERPDEWDPLWTVELQGEARDYINDLCAHDKALLVGMSKTLFAVTGDSQYNWQRDPVRKKVGSAGAGSIASDGVQAYWVSASGVYDIAQAAPISDDLVPLFGGPLYGAQAVIDPRRRLLLVFVQGRLFVMHLDRAGLFGEIKASAAGLLALDDYVGWYGADGVWVLGALDEPDRRLDGTLTDVTARYQTWDERPNRAGSGRSLLNRLIIEAKGSPHAAATYTLSVDGAAAYSETFMLADDTVATWGTLQPGATEGWPTRPVRRELVPRQAGELFEHTISATCHIELLAFDPQYRYEGRRP